VWKLPDDKPFRSFNASPGWKGTTSAAKK
jgi:hypothetical protein